MIDVAAQLVADPADPDTMGFIRSLLNTPISLSRGLSRKDAQDGRPVRVPTRESKYPDNTCWFNCVDYAAGHGAGMRVVFGWAIWKIGGNDFVAQHHAVVRDVRKGLMDVTLHAAYPEILFVPDDRVAFDFKDMRYPFSYRNDKGHVTWFALGKTEPMFAIAKMDATPPDVQSIIDAGLRAGVL